MQKLEEDFTEVGKFTEVTSDITTRTLLVNMSDSKFQIHPAVPMEKVRSIGSLQVEHWEALSAMRMPRGNLKSALTAFSSIQAIEDYRKAINRLLTEALKSEEEAKVRKSLRGAKARALDLLMRLWAENLIAWPTSLPLQTVSKYNYNEFTLGRHNVWFKEISSASSSKSAVVRVRCATVMLRSAMTTIGIEEIGDLTPMSVDIKRWPGLEKQYFPALKCLMVAQQRQYGKAAVFPSARWTKHLTSEVVDNSFLWASNQNAAAGKWLPAIHDWLANATGRMPLRRTAIKHFLTYILSLPEPLPGPVQYCRRDYLPSISFAQWREIHCGKFSTTHRARLSNVISEFFDWLLANHLTFEDDFGRPVISPEHYNPIARLRCIGIAAQTHREAMPIRYINELETILIENDYEWARQRLTDYFSFYNETGKCWERIWSPVRAIAILIKLNLPLRTFQVRMLDSGEADSEVYRGGQWVRNEGPLAPTPSSPVASRGFLRRFEDRKVNRSFTGFYINTNKTADRMRDPEDRGYDIPWQHEKVISWVEMLVEWQKKYNFHAIPLSWGNIQERELLRTHSQQSLHSRGEVTFLFRDPCAPDRRYPLRGSKLASMWNMLLDELEQRVFARGERLPDGGKITFIKTRGADGRAASPVYDLHALRVSLLTAFATEGGVPIDILSKCVAGHASILMTIYYIKTGPAYITEKLAEAQERIASKEKESLVRFMMDAELSRIEESIAYNDSAATSAIIDSNPGSWVVGDRGICPVGGDRCAVGGPKVTNLDYRANDYSPVPGGAKNCVRCRFFITGPAFLGGLVAHFNSTGLKLMEASRRYREHSEVIQSIEERMEAARKKSISFEDSKHLDLAYERQDQLMKEVDEIASNWHCTYKLIERCKSIMAGDKKETGLSLVLAGTRKDLDVALELTTDFELIDAVCQVANVYPAESTTIANLRRGRILDAMLLRNSCKPVFTVLTDDEALRVGNEFVTFLKARMGRQAAAALMEGNRMLSNSGVAKDAQALLEQLTGHPLRLSALIEPNSDQRQLLGYEVF